MPNKQGVYAQERRHALNEINILVTSNSWNILYLSSLIIYFSPYLGKMIRNIEKISQFDLLLVVGLNCF